MASKLDFCLMRKSWDHVKNGLLVKLKKEGMYVWCECALFGAGLEFGCVLRDRGSALPLLMLSCAWKTEQTPTANDGAEKLGQRLLLALVKSKKLQFKFSRSLNYSPQAARSTLSTNNMGHPRTNSPETSQLCWGCLGQVIRKQRSVWRSSRPLDGVSPFLVNEVKWTFLLV